MHNAAQEVRKSCAPSWEHTVMPKLHGHRECTGPKRTVGAQQPQAQLRECTWWQRVCSRCGAASLGRGGNRLLLSLHLPSVGHEKGLHDDERSRQGSSGRVQLQLVVAPCDAILCHHEALAVWDLCGAWSLLREVKAARRKLISASMCLCKCCQAWPHLCVVQWFSARHT